MSGRVLIIEDDPALATLLRAALGKRGYQTATAPDADAALQRLDEHDPEAVLTDLHLGTTDGLALCRTLAERRPGLPVVVMTAFGSLDTAVQAMRSGAWDFLTKPLDLEVLDLALQRAVAHRRLTEELRTLRRRARSSAGLDELVGDSPPMQRLYKLIERVSAAPSSVLITGESGTGKELVARALHRLSDRANGNFVATNCAAVPESLLESELFGHVRGAFTDARQARNGLFVEASGGSLFLDEIGDMPAGLQPKLLRVLQERAVRPVGGDREVEVDVRIIAATHQDLEGAVETGRFRADLLYRLDVIRLELPPLRDRGGDVLLLAQRFIRHHAERLKKNVDGLDPNAARRLLEYSWPGNVRELQNAMERAVLLAEATRIGVDDLPPRLQRHEPRQTVLATTEDPSAMLPMHEVERRYILRVLEAVEGNKATAARVLEIDRKTLYRKLAAWGLGGEEVG